MQLALCSALPALQSGSCTLREAVIVGSLLHRHRIPEVYSAAAIVKLACLPPSPFSFL